jgi:hypothetical protein
MQQNLYAHPRLQLICNSWSPFNSPNLQLLIARRRIAHFSSATPDSPFSDLSRGALTFATSSSFESLGRPSSSKTSSPEFLADNLHRSSFKSDLKFQLSVQYRLKNHLRKVPPESHSGCPRSNSLCFRTLHWEISW